MGRHFNPLFFLALGFQASIATSYHPVIGVSQLRIMPQSDPSASLETTRHGSRPPPQQHPTVVQRQRASAIRECPNTCRRSLSAICPPSPALSQSSLSSLRSTFSRSSSKPNRLQTNGPLFNTALLTPVQTSRRRSQSPQVIYREHVDTNEDVSSSCRDSRRSSRSLLHGM